MSNSIQNIKTLINSLPSKDINLAGKFLIERNFESLKELVDSAIIRTRKNVSSEHPKDEYTVVNLDRLNMLKAEVDIYCIQLELPQQDNDEYE